MTVPSEINRAGPYFGNGVTTVFSFGFRIVDETHLSVVAAGADGVETILSLGADYSVSGVGSDAGGSITTALAPGVGVAITILRQVPFTQEIDLENQGPYFAETIERALDLSVMRDQELAEQLSRAVMVPAGGEGGALASDLAEGILRLMDSADNIDAVAGVAGDVTVVSGAVDDVRVVSENIEALLAASGSVLNLVDRSYVAEDGQYIFTLPAYAVAPENVLAWIDGVRQVPGVGYSVNGAEIEFDSPLNAGVEVDVLVISAVSFNQVNDMYDEVKKAALFCVQTILTTAGQRVYSVDTDGLPLNVARGAFFVVGSAPFGGGVTPDVDVTATDDGAVQFNFDPKGDELFTVLSFPRLSPDDVQAVLDNYKDAVAAVVAAEADRAEAAADRSEDAARIAEDVIGGPGALQVFVDTAEGWAEDAERAALNAAAARNATQAAADASIQAGQWDQDVADEADRLALTGLASGWQVYQRDTEHVWRWDGSAWINRGPSPLVWKATYSDVVGTFVRVAETPDPEVLEFHVDGWWYVSEVVPVPVPEDIDIELPVLVGGDSDRLAIYARDDWWYPHVSYESPPVPEPGGDVVAAYNPLDRYVRDEEVLPVWTDLSRVSLWGSSTMQTFGSAIAPLFAPLDATLIAEGKGGERSADTMARLGAGPLTLTFPAGEIPSGTAPVVVGVSSTYGTITSSLKPFKATVEGVVGTITYASGSTATWVRDEAGQAVTLSGDVAAEPVVGLAARNAVAIINIGKNNITMDASATAGAAVSISAINAAYDWLGPLVKRSIVMGHFVDRDQTPEHHEAVATVNRALSRRYGPLFIDVQSYLMGSQVWVDTGITPNATSLGDQAAGRLPTQLSSDTRHMNTTTLRAVFNTLVLPLLTALGVK